MGKERVCWAFSQLSKILKAVFWRKPQQHNNNNTTTNENAPWVLSLKHQALGWPSRKKEANLASVSSQATLCLCKLGFPGAQPRLLPSVCPWLLLHWNPHLNSCNGSDMPAKPKYLLWSAGEKSRRFLPWGINKIGEILLVFSLFYMVAWGERVTEKLACPSDLYWMTSLFHWE